MSMTAVETEKTVEAEEEWEAGHGRASRSWSAVVCSIG